jgi:hypothetical protein
VRKSGNCYSVVVGYGSCRNSLRLKNSSVYWDIIRPNTKADKLLRYLMMLVTGFISLE